jgi:xanthine dehydrogenase accessory factor
MQRLEEFTQRLAAQDAVLVTVAATQGSVPREAGTWMAVFADAVLGTIGGGHLEFDAIAEARRRLEGAAVADPAAAAIADAAAAAVAGEPVLRFALGPSLGQCCGGVVHLRFERVGATDTQALRERLRTSATPVALFGGGHVGTALVRLLGTLPFEVTWIDSRDGIFPERLPANATCDHSEPVQDAVADLAPRSRVLVMSFSHAEDLDIVAACLKRLRERGDLPYVGLIGSRTKWATFRHRLEQRGFTDAELARITCPIGVPGIEGKEPEVIAVAVAAQLLQLAPS